MRFLALIALLLAFCGQLACNSSSSSARRKLPPDANPAHGRIAFVAHNCHACHSVSGAGLPAPTARIALNVELGRECERRPSDDYLYASILNPSVHLGHYPQRLVAANGRSKMPDLAADLSPRELTDIVAFLQQEHHH